MYPPVTQFQMRARLFEEGLRLRIERAHAVERAARLPQRAASPLSFRSLARIRPATGS